MMQLPTIQLMAGHDLIINQMYGVSRSSKWDHVAHQHLAKQPHCLICGRQVEGTRLNVHHKYPYHYVIALGRPDLELLEENLFTMCVDDLGGHHLLIGHLGYYESYNPNLEEHISLCRGLLVSQIKQLRPIQLAINNRPTPLRLMNDDMKSALRKELNHRFPLAG